MSDLDDHDLAEPVEVFEQQRPRLLGVAYRILGSLADAEDVVQEAWLRWSRTDVAGVESAEAYLTTVTSRLAVDRLRRVSRQREPISANSCRCCGSSRRWTTPVPRMTVPGRRETQARNARASSGRSLTRHHVRQRSPSRDLPSRAEIGS